MNSSYEIAHVKTTVIGQMHLNNFERRMKAYDARRSNIHADLLAIIKKNPNEFIIIIIGLDRTPHVVMLTNIIRTYSVNSFPT